MLSRRALVIGAAALGAGCGPMRSFLLVPSLPKPAELTWFSLTFGGLYEPAAREQDLLAKLQSAVAALGEDKENPNGPVRGNYRVTPRLIENWHPYPASWGQLVDWLGSLEVDLLSLPAPMVRALADQRVLLPIDRVLSADSKLLTQEFYPYLLDPYRFEGSLYALPVNALPLMLYYDARYFAAAGVPPVDSGWNWDALVESAVTLTRRDESGATEHWGFEAHRYGLWWMLWQNEAELRDPETGECCLQDPAAGEALEFYSNLLHNHRVSPPLMSDDAAKLYEVTADSWPAMFYTPRQHMWNGDYRWAKLPHGKVRSVPVYSDMSIAITDWTEDLEAAATALKGLVGIMQQYVSVPAKREAVAQLAKFRRNLRPAEVAAVQASLEHGRMLPQGVPMNDGIPTLAQALSMGDAAFQLTREAAPGLDRILAALVRGDHVEAITSRACARV